MLLLFVMYFFIFQNSNRRRNGEFEQNIKNTNPLILAMKGAKKSLTRESERERVFYLNIFVSFRFRKEILSLTPKSIRFMQMVNKEVAIFVDCFRREIKRKFLPFKLNLISLYLCYVAFVF